MRMEQLTEKHLNGIQTLWNREWSELFPLRSRLIEQNVFGDPNWLPEGSWVAIDENDEMIGFVIAKGAMDELVPFGIPRDLGWVQVLLVARPARAKGIGSELLRRAEGALRRHGAKRILLGNDLQSRLFPGLPEPTDAVKRWFEKRGFAYQEETYDLVKHYAEGETVELPDLHGASLSIATGSDRERMEAFMSRCFPGAWDYQLREYWKRGGTGREFVLLERDGEIIGFCRMNDEHSPLLAQNIYWSQSFEASLGGIGPLGIDEVYRGYRYGISIVQAAIHYLLQRGTRSIVIDTTPFVDFYGKLGYETWRTYAKYEKTVADQPVPVLEETADRLQVKVYADRVRMGAAAANDIAEHILELLAQKENIRIIFAAAPSQNEMLAALASRHDLPWNRIEALHMDEYIGLKADAPQSFGSFLKEALFDRVDLGSVQLIDGNADSEAECARYSILLRERPIDIVCLGIGENGHLAFNDPPVADFQDAKLVKVVELEEACRRQQVNDGCFDAIDEVPTTALTLTIPALMSGARLFCVVPGPLKRQAVAATLTLPISERHPSTILRTHPDCTLYVDRDAYGHQA